VRTKPKQAKVWISLTSLNNAKEKIHLSRQSLLVFQDVLQPLLGAGCIVHRLPHVVLNDY
jgi:hypothetical protein